MKPCTCFAVVIKDAGKFPAHKAEIIHITNHLPDHLDTTDEQFVIKLKIINVVEEAPRYNVGSLSFVGISTFLSNLEVVETYQSKQKGGSVLHNNPLISPSLTDEIELDLAGNEVYTHDCHNLPICKSYGSHFAACLAGAFAGNRCSHGEKMNIRILNDMNPNAIYRPEKPSPESIVDYIKG